MKDNSCKQKWNIPPSPTLKLIFFTLTIACLTPQCHNNGKGNGGWVVKQVGGSGVSTTVGQLPVGAALVTHWTHCVVTDDRVFTNLCAVKGKGVPGNVIIMYREQHVKHEKRPLKAKMSDYNTWVGTRKIPIKASPFISIDSLSCPYFKLLIEGSQIWSFFSNMKILG